MTVTEKIITWINSKSVQEAINSGSNWKLIINGSGTSIKAIVEKHDKLPID